MAGRSKDKVDRYKEMFGFEKAYFVRKTFSRNRSRREP